MSKNQTPTFEINTAALPANKKREHLFTIDGTQYTIPEKLGAEIGLQATRIADERGEVAAEMFIIDQTIGREAFDALSNVENLPASTLKGILTVCRERVFGVMESEGKG